MEFFHDRTNLHRVWDSGLIRRTKKPWPAYATELRQAITPEQLARWKSTDPVEWATESYKLALSHAYAIPKDGQLGQAYFDRCIPVVNQRLAMAGAHLAMLLNAIFGDRVLSIPPAEPSQSQNPGAALDSLTHSPISILVAQGKTCDQIAAFVGHLDQKTTQRYIHFMPKDEKETANSIPFEF